MFNDRNQTFLYKCCPEGAYFKTVHYFQSVSDRGTMIAGIKQPKNYENESMRSFFICLIFITVAQP